MDLLCPLSPQLSRPKSEISVSRHKSRLEDAMAPEFLVNTLCRSLLRAWPQETAPDLKEEKSQGSEADN